MKLLIVADEPAARTGLIRMCEGVPDMRVVGEANTGATALTAVASLRPDLMFLDADLPDMSGLEVLRMLRRRQQHRTILITANAQDASIAFAAGAIGHLLKPVNEAAFCASILRAKACTAPRLTDEHRPLFLVGEREHRLYPLDPFEIDYVQSAGN